MNSIKDNVNQVIKLLKDSPALLIQGDVKSLSNYISFFEGFFICLKLINNKDVEREISKWYQSRVAFKAPNMNWFAQFKLIHKEKLEKDIILLLLNEMKLFYDSENIN